jgi:hypothetical protein
MYLIKIHTNKYINYNIVIILEQNFNNNVGGVKSIIQKI